MTLGFTEVKGTERNYTAWNAAIQRRIDADAEIMTAPTGPAASWESLKRTVSDFARAHKGLLAGVAVVAALAALRSRPD